MRVVTLAETPDGTNAERVSLATLREGDAVHGTYACTRKERLMTRAGSPYLAIELRDQTGTMPARVFNRADLLAGQFDRGDLVQVTGTVERFRDELQVAASQVTRVAADQEVAAAFLPTAYRDLDELDGFLEHLSGEVHDPGYRALLAVLLADEQLRTELRRAPCTRSGHHAYLGGLLEHTVAVGTLALEVCQLHIKLNSDLLLCAALVHDLGKTREFTYGAELGLTDEGRMLGHVELGLRLIDDAAGAVPELDDGRRLALAHCVLTHHGADATGRGGGRFGSAEALALYRINALDTSVKGALEQGLALER
jgi:3'-5' exoribonuclease